VGTSARQALTVAQAQRFQQAVALLRSGQPAEALAIAQDLAAQSPRAADAWQLIGLCQAGAGGHGEAADAFEQALALVPGNAAVSRNYGVFLAGRGKALREQDAPEVAEPVLRKALTLVPDLPSAWVDLGMVLRLLGRVEEGLAALRRADSLLQQRGAPSPEVQDAIGGALADAGRATDALAAARALVASHPGYAPGHETLGRLLWEHGAELAPGEDPLATFRAAATAQPDNHALQLSLARLLLAVGRPDEVLALVDPLRQRDPGNALLDWFAADALDALGQREQAARLFAAAAKSELAEFPEFLNARARHAFRSGQIDLAAACAAKVVEFDPRNQEGWSHRGTAWRLLGDEREHWLCDYERLVGYVEIEAPPGVPDLETFLAALAATLDTLHNAGREPVHQSVRGGTQTAGQLFGRDVPMIRAAESALAAAVERWLATLPDDDGHPFLSMKRPGARFVGSWSVRLGSSGSHSNHIHPRGWASSAFYVALPDLIDQAGDGSTHGWLQFGVPVETLGLHLPPRRLIRPRPGHLALFPSYMWHGTVPFEASQPRLTIAFDMRPKG